MMIVDIEDIRTLMVEIFSPATIPDDCSDSTLGDFSEWDSLGNFNFLLAVEEFYEIRFDIEEMSEIKSIKELLETLEKK